MGAKQGAAHGSAVLQLVGRSLQVWTILEGSSPLCVHFQQSAPARWGARAARLLHRCTSLSCNLCCAAAPLHSLPAPCSDGCYISKGYDATTHFETTVDDVLDMYKRITGKDIDLNSKDPRLAQQQE